MTLVLKIINFKISIFYLFFIYLSIFCGKGQTRRDQAKASRERTQTNCRREAQGEESRRRLQVKQRQNATQNSLFDEEIVRKGQFLSLKITIYSK